MKDGRGTASFFLSLLSEDAPPAALCPRRANAGSEEGATEQPGHRGPLQLLFSSFSLRATSKKQRRSAASVLVSSSVVVVGVVSTVDCGSIFFGGGSLVALGGGSGGASVGSTFFPSLKQKTIS